MVSTKIVDLDENIFVMLCLRMTPEQCRAREHGWAFKTSLPAPPASGISTIRDFEAGRRAPIANNLAAIRTALELKGIVFVNDEKTPGIAFKNS